MAASAIAITENISKIAKLPPSQSRAAASILGAVVADAAARPLHWVYDRYVGGNTQVDLLNCNLL